MRELEGLGLVHIPPAKRGAKKHVQILWQPSRGVSPAIGEIPDLPPVPTRHHATGTRGSAAKSLEMKRYAKVEPSRRTGNISTNLPDEQETNLPDERDTTFPANGNPLSYEASYEGVVVGNSSYEDSFSYLTTHEAADLEFYVAADFETGELLEAPPDDGRRDLSDAELDEWEQPDCPVIFDDWYVNSTAGAFEADGECSHLRWKRRTRWIRAFAEETNNRLPQTPQGANGGKRMILPRNIPSATSPPLVPRAQKGRSALLLK